MSVKQDIYKTLIQSGMTEAAALGMMGNWQCESGLEAGRLQGDFSAYRTLSKTYVARATNGETSRDQFARDSYGFGLAQWTYYSRKYALWDFWKQSGKELDDPIMQTEFAVAELKQNYHNLWEELLVNNDIYTCAAIICEQYERPAHNNINDRFRAAKELQTELIEKEPEPQIGVTEFWPPRTLQKGMKGDDVLVLKAILRARGFNIGKFTGTFSNTVKCSVLAWQGEMGLKTDGIVGEETWASLLCRG